MWKVGRKRCLREMVLYIHRCHRDLFLFLWGFTTVTKLSFQDFFPKKLLGHLSFAMGTAPVAKLFFYSGFGFRFQTQNIKRSNTSIVLEREGRKLRVGEGVFKIISLGTFLEIITSPTPHLKWLHSGSEGLRPSVSWGSVNDVSSQHVFQAAF